MTPDLFDPLKLKWNLIKAKIAPWLILIRLAIYAAALLSAFISGCNHGKDGGKAERKELSDKLETCQSDSREQAKALSQIAAESEAYRRQSAQQAKDLAKAQSELKAAQKRAEAETAELERMLKDAYAKNRQWADSGVPADYLRLLND